jgi:hypothetical protein
LLASALEVDVKHIYSKFEKIKSIALACTIIAYVDGELITVSFK